MKKARLHSIGSKCTEFYDSSKVLSRNRLIRKFDSGLNGAISLVYAPAGYGKTVTVEDWIRKKKWKILWVDLSDSSAIEVRRPTSPTVFIFDCCEEISPNVYENAMMRMAELPEHSHAVFLSRVKPSFSLSKWRLKGELNEICGQDLRFTNEETKQLFHSISGKRLDQNSLNMIQTYTEGWPAAVSYAARCSDDKSDIRNTFDLSVISQFLKKEIFQPLSLEFKHFLLKTSILESLNVRLCHQLVGNDKELEMIQQAEKTNLFVFQDPGRRYNWRYHPLFALFLQSECKQWFGNEEFQSLHRKAAEWFHENGEPDLAIDHALEGGNEGTAKKWLLQRSPDLLRKGEYQKIQRWFEWIPDPSGELSLIKGWVKAFDEQYDEALDDFQRLEGRDYAKMAERAIGLGYIAICKGDPNQAIERFKEATSKWEEISSIFRRGIDLNFCEVETLKGRLGMGGRIHNAWRLYSQIEELWANKDLAVLAYGSTIKAELLYEKNRLDEVVHFIMKGIELGDRYENTSVLFSIHLVYMKLKRATGHLHEMWTIFDNVKKMVEQSSDSMNWQPVLRAFEIRMMLHEKNPDVSELEEWLNRHSNCELETVDFKNEFIMMTIVRGLTRQRKYSRSLKLLDIWGKAASQAGRIGSQIEIGLQKVLILNRRGNFKKACRELYQVLVLGEQEGYVRSFLDCGYPLSQILAAALQKSSLIKEDPVIKSYTKSLLSLFEQELGVRNWSNRNRTLTEPLTDRELEILRYIVKGFSNTVIAGRLGIKVGTVKTHIVNLYGKLGVENRAQAVVKAEELGLVQI